MKKRTKGMDALWGLLLVAISLSACTKEEQLTDLPSRSITFILSADSPGKDYFQLATEYFRTDPADHTDLVTSECRSIACVIDYLNAHADGARWSKINLVAHGNAKTGLNLYLSDGGHKATPKRLVQEVIVQSLPTLQDHSVDSTTVIRLLACGIGTNPMISLSMKNVFRTEKGARPAVSCSDKYVIFRPDANGRVQMLEADYWTYFHKRGYRPSVGEIDQQMSAAYPRDSMLWDELLQSTDDRAMTTEYHIPISYTRTYDKKDDRPRFSSQAEREKWARAQPAIQSQLSDMDMAFDDFHWQVDRRILRDIDGKPTYAVKAIGMTTSICFLRVRE